MDSIPDASAGNLYLVWVAPGYYNEMVTLKPYVHLQGAGERVTFIQVEAPNGVVLKLSSDTSVRDLSVSNGGSATPNYGMNGNSITKVQVSDVNVEAGGIGTSKIGIRIMGSSEVILESVEAAAGKATGSHRHCR